MHFTGDEFTPSRQAAKSICFHTSRSVSTVLTNSLIVHCNGVTCLTMKGWKVWVLDECWILISWCDQWLLSESFSVCGLGKILLLWLIYFMDLRDSFFKRVKSPHFQGLHTHSWNLTFKKPNSQKGTKTIGSFQDCKAASSSFCSREPGLWKRQI